MRIAGSMTTVVTAACLLYGCPESTVDECNRDPTQTECIPDASVVGGLTYRTQQARRGDDWVSVELGLCGHFDREIVWLMPDGAPSDGYIVQQVDITMTATCSVSEDSPYLDECTDPPSVERLPDSCIDDNGEPFIERGTIRFWEAFPLSEGDERYINTDLWSLQPQAVAEGEATIAGSARFYPSEAMADEHPDNANSPFQRMPVTVGASVLPSTLEEPMFWRRDQRGTLDRHIRVSWRCCPPMVTVLEEDGHDR